MNTGRLFCCCVMFLLVGEANAPCAPRPAPAPLAPGTQGAIRPLRPGYLGLVLTTLDPAAARAARLGAGLSVEDVVRGGPAAAAGIQPGDLILGINRRSVQEPVQIAELRKIPAGSRVLLRLLRKGRAVSVGVVSGEAPVLPRLPEPEVGDLIPAQPQRVVIRPVPTGRPIYVSGRVLAGSSAVDTVVIAAYDGADGGAGEDAAAITSPLSNGAYVLRLPAPGPYRLRVSTYGRGFSVEKDVDVPARGLTKLDLVIPERAIPNVIHRSYLGLVLRQRAVIPHPLLPGAGTGAVVEEVMGGGPGAAAGVQAGDEILALDGTTVHDPVQLSALVRRLPPGKAVLLRILRNGHRIGIRATLEEMEHAPARVQDELPEVRELELGAQRYREAKELGLRRRF